MKVNSSVSNNSYKNPYTSQKERKDCNFKGYTFVKTLEMTAIDSSDSKWHTYTRQIYSASLFWDSKIFE